MENMQNALPVPVERTIAKWFEDAQRSLSDMSVNDDRFVVDFCAAALGAMKTYCRSVGALLDGGFRQPAAALLRIVVEFLVKLVWCLHPNTEEQMKGRIGRWEKTSGLKKRKLLCSLLESPERLTKHERQTLEDELTRTQDDLCKRDATEPMPSVTGKDSLFAQTSTVFRGDVSAYVYRQFCAAVHIDTTVLTGLSLPVRGIRGFQEDFGDRTELAKIALNQAYMVLLVIYRELGLDCRGLDQEYDSAMSLLRVGLR